MKNMKILTTAVLCLLLSFSMGATAMAESITSPDGQLKLDFSGVQFMDSSGIGLIMGRYKLIQTWGGGVTIANLPPKLEKIVSLSGLRDLCTIVKEVKEVEGEE